MLPTGIPSDSTEDDTQVNPEAVEMARQAVRDFGVRCFWWWNEDANLNSRAAIREVVEALRVSGGREGWQAAQQLIKCL
jgi:hypothetical protein